MTLMKKRKVIAYAKQERNLFVLELAIVKAIMAIKSLNPMRAMAITGYGRQTHLVSQDKCIRP